MDNGNARKNCLFTKIAVKVGEIEKYINSFNIHFHWKSNEENLEQFGKNIYEVLSKQENNSPYFICGDFNKPINDPILIKFFKKLSNFDSSKIKIAKSDNLQDNFTAMDTRNKPVADYITLHSDPPYNKLKFAIIDNIILGGNLEYSLDPEIISNINDIDIFYDLKAIDVFLKENESEKIKDIACKWKQERKNKDISDHKPIKTTIKLL